jgi:hypothetical protein
LDVAPPLQKMPLEQLPHTTIMVGEKEYVPAGHAVHAVAPNGATEPTAQAVHDDKPATEELPAAHCEHAEAPIPAADPAGQMVHEAEPAAETEPGAQVEHTEALLAPVADEFVPAAHATGAAPLPGQYQPCGHVTVFDVALPLQNLPAEHTSGG